VSPRARYIVRRLFQAIPVIIAMSIFVFLMIHLVPGDPVQTMLGFRATRENVATVRAQLGLDEPLLTQYLTWVSGALHGNFGQDFISHVPVSTLLAQRLPVTIELTLLSMTLAVLVGVPLGVRAAARSGLVRHATEGFVVSLNTCPAPPVASSVARARTMSGSPLRMSIIVTPASPEPSAAGMRSSAR
jgi:peptide/nickel transport system permease protein